MSSYRKLFSRPYSLFPVIHVASPLQALRNAEIAFGEGADGIFLINHDIPAYSLSASYLVVREKYPESWIGLNYLDLSPRAAFDLLLPTASGMWVDDAGVDEESGDVSQACAFHHSRSIWQPKLHPRFLVFGGVAFKYQKKVLNVGKAAALAKPYVDVITTSGEATGRAPDLEKIRQMRGAIGDFPLAIASGITPENVSHYLGSADCFLVATGISRSHTELDSRRVRLLVQQLK